MNPLYPPVADRAEHRCEYSRAPEIVFNFPFEVDHILPKSRGGSDHSDNLALACHACNLFKSDFDLEQGDASPKLFHPRQDVWKEHFHLDAAAAEIVGTTPADQATVTRLQMNRPQQIEA